jgi:ATP-dependent Clp protease protease subunit
MNNITNSVKGSSMEEKKMEKNNNVLKELEGLTVSSKIETRMMKRREIFIWEAIHDESAKAVVQKILFFDGESDEDITMYVNSPGGVISAGLAIIDAMRYAKSDISTICMGQAASMGALILCCGTKGKRYAWTNSRVMIHQPLISDNFFGPASDIQIHAEEMVRIRKNLNQIMADATGKKLETIEEDTERDYFMSAEEAKKYGLIDDVLKSYC